MAGGGGTPAVPARLSTLTIDASKDWLGYQIRNLACENGVTFPATPVLGQYFLHTPTGRKIYYQYDGTNWIPVISLGTMTVYVDQTDGTDDLEHGTGVDADAFATIQYAIDSIPPVSYGNIVININDENYAEDIQVGARLIVTHGDYAPAANDKFIKFIGTLTEVASLVATGGTQGNAAAPATVTGAFVVGVHDNLLLEFTSGLNNGTRRIVGKTIAGALYLVGAALPAIPLNGDTYKIYDWATTIQSVDLDDNPTPIRFDDIAFSHNADTVIWAFKSHCQLFSCKVTNAGADVGFKVDHAFGATWSCLFLVTAAGYRIAIDAEWSGNLDYNNTRLVGFGGANGVGIRLTGAGVGSLKSGEILDFQYGIACQVGGVADMYVGDVKHYIHGCNTNGIQAANHGQAITNAGGHITFGVELDGVADANGADTWADAASFSWIG